MFNYVFYLFGAVSLCLNNFKDKDYGLTRVLVSVTALVYCCCLGQVICTLCRGIWYLRDQMYHCWLRHERLPGRLDSHNQVHCLTFGDCIRLICWKRGAQCPLCCVYWKRDFAVLWKVQTKCVEDEGNPYRISGSWSRCCFWQPYWRRLILPGGQSDGPDAWNVY